MVFPIGHYSQANIGNGLATFDFDLTSETSSCCLSSSGNSVDPVFMKGVNQDSQMVGLTYLNSVFFQFLWVTTSLI